MHDILTHRHTREGSSASSNNRFYDVDMRKDIPLHHKENKRC